MIQSSTCIIESFNISQRQAASCNIMWNDFLHQWTLKIYSFFLNLFFLFKQANKDMKKNIFMYECATNKQHVYLESTSFLSLSSLSSLRNWARDFCACGQSAGWWVIAMAEGRLLGLGWTILCGNKTHSL